MMARIEREITLVEIASAMARYHQGYEYGCYWCGKKMPHDSTRGDGTPDPHVPDCPVTKARQLVYGEPARQATVEGE